MSYVSQVVLGLGQAINGMQGIVCNNAFMTL